MTLPPVAFQPPAFAPAPAFVAARRSEVFTLDSSALLAYLIGEPGSAIVGGLLLDPQARRLAHTVNLVEVAYHVERVSGAAARGAALEALKADGVTEKRTLSASFALRVSHLKSLHRMALGDAFGLALALHTGGAFVTADRHELAALCGLYPIRFIR